MDFDKLDSFQLNIVRWSPGGNNLRVIASAGSGKTTSVVALVTKLILVDEVDAADICVLTYANKAGNELRVRLGEALGAGVVSNMAVGTYHAVGLNFLKRINPEKWDMTRCCDLPQGSRVEGMPSTHFMWRSAVVFGSMPGTGESSLKVADAPDQHLQQVCLQRAEGRSPEDAKGSGSAPKFKQAWLMVERCKAYYNAWDFDDVLMAWRKWLKTNEGGRYKVVIVDESQDNNKLQLELAQLLRREEGNIVLVGDLRQTVHEWRGAYPKLFAEADQTLSATTMELCNNYRSRPKIVELSNAYAKGKKWNLGSPSNSTRDADGQSVFTRSFPGHFEEGAFIAEHIAEELENGIERTRAVLCRTRGLIAIIEGCLLANNVPVVIAGGSSAFKSPPAQAVMNYLAAIHEDSVEALINVLNMPKRFIPRTFATKLQGTRRARGEKVEETLRRLVYTDSMSTGSRTNALELADKLESMRAASWSDQVREVCQLLAASWDDNGDANENDNNGLAYSVATFAMRFPDYTLFKEFLTVQLRARQDDPNAVVLSTIHKAKGLEWDDVYVDVTHGLLPHRRARGSAIEEEQRLLYVAITRPKERLFLLSAEEGQHLDVGGVSSLLKSMSQGPKSDAETDISALGGLA